MIEASAADGALISRLRKTVSEMLETRINQLIANPDPRNAGYIAGARDVLQQADEIFREINSPTIKG